MTTSAALPGLPAEAELLDGLWAGALDRDPRAGRGGRVRRWSYSAAGSAGVAVGAAIIDLGFLSAAFAWGLVEDELVTWDARGLPRLASRMGVHAGTGARFRSMGGRLAIGPEGDLDVDVPVRGGRLVARTEVRPDTPAVCATATPGGGWNTTQKVAGEVARIEVATPAARVATTGGTWRDWTLGAQDRDTTWRWAAGAGRSVDGRRVGFNVSTGMNAAGQGEDVVWWDGVPHRLGVEHLDPIGALAGDWRILGRHWALHLAVAGVREADDDLFLVRSRYVQPVGTFTGTLPDPEGIPTPVTLVGVTEEHETRW